MKAIEMEAENQQNETLYLENVSKFRSFKYHARKKLWNMFYEGSKRLFDICCGIAGCICLVPILIVVKLAYLKNHDTAPILFKQERIGKDGEKIYIYKIRSMVDHAEDVLEELMRSDPKIREEYLTNKKLENDPRVTKIGRFIRRTSLDEFGQFINVLKGEMTMIGPRPYLPREKEDMRRYYKDIITCKPGITGLWQASGRSNVNFDNRCRLDSFYSKHKCLIFDLKIFTKTFSAVLNSEGAK